MTPDAKYKNLLALENRLATSVEAVELLMIDC